jgi:WD40 repeat protein
MRGVLILKWTLHNRNTYSYPYHGVYPHTPYNIQQTPQAITPERRAELIAKFAADPFLETLFRIESLPVEVQQYMLTPLIQEMVEPQLQECILKPIHTFHTHFLMSVSYHPSGKYVASGSYSKGLQIWDAITGNADPVNTINPHEVSSVCFDSQGNRLGWIESYRRFVLTDTTNFLPVFSAQYNATTLSLSADGRWIASGSQGTGTSGVQIWDSSSGTPGPFREYPTNNNINSVSFSPIGLLVASGSDNGRVQIWDVQSPSFEPVQTFISKTKRVTEHINSVSFNKDGIHVASGGSSGYVRIWDITSSDPQPVREFATPSYISSVSFNPDGSLLAAGSHKKVMIWDLTSASPWPMYTFDTRFAVESISFSGDGTRIASGSRNVEFDSKIDIWGLSHLWREQLYSTHPKHMLFLVILAKLYNPDKQIVLNEKEKNLFNTLPSELQTTVKQCFKVVNE